MPFQNYFRNGFLAPLSSRVLWLFIICGLILSSCKKQPNKYSNYSDGFKVIYSHTLWYYDNRKADEGLHYLDSAFNHLDHATVNDRFRFYSLHFMYDKKVTHDAHKELLYADSMASLAPSGLNEKLALSNYAEANFARGDAYFDLRLFNDAYRCYYQGYFTGKNSLDNTELAEYTYRMGMIMFKQSHFNAAANYFKESYRQSFAYNDDFKAFYQRQELLNDIGESYQNNGNTDSAVLYFNKTLDYINKNDERFKGRTDMLDVARAVTYGDLGLIFSTKKQYKQAAEQFKKSIDINLRKYNDNSDAELVEINLGRLYLSQHQYAPFISLMHNMQQQFDSVKNIDALTSWNKLMSDYYRQKNDFTKAFTYYKSYTSFKDSLSRQSASLKQTDVNQQLSNYEKQYQIQNLKDNNKLQLIYLYLSVAGVVMAVVIIFLVYRNWNRSKNDVVAVSELNRQINLQNADMEKTLNELKLNSQEKDRILHTVAHDLRNPIGGIVSLTNAMLEDDYNEDQQSLLKLVNETSYNSLELINEILEATNNKNTSLNKELVDINSLVNNSVEILNFKAAEKDQHITTELLANPRELLISREKIWRVISNLISNAIKFSPNDTAIKIKIHDSENEIKISVSDSGIGIPDNIKDQVFNTFTNAKRPGTAGEKSFGLGLSICQQIIENHDGKIWFESNDNPGTTFHISLPAI